jgi:hypothetical protein
MVWEDGRSSRAKACTICVLRIFCDNGFTSTLERAFLINVRIVRLLL